MLVCELTADSEHPGQSYGLGDAGDADGRDLLLDGVGSGKCKQKVCRAVKTESDPAI